MERWGGIYIVTRWMDGIHVSNLRKDRQQDMTKGKLEDSRRTVRCTRRITIAYNTFLSLAYPQHIIDGNILLPFVPLIICLSSISFFFLDSLLQFPFNLLGISPVYNLLALILKWYALISFPSYYITLFIILYCLFPSQKLLVMTPIILNVLYHN